MTHPVARPVGIATRQRGAAALAVALVLLFGMTLVAFYANRNLIFEQRTSANQYRATRAFEMAEAGLEWAAARLNDDDRMSAGTDCSNAGTTISFADRYLPITLSGGVPTGFATIAARPGCSIDPASGAASCSCPTAGNPGLGDAAHPRFSVAFNTPVAGDAWAVEIVSTGCTNAGPACDNPGGAGAPPDGVATVRAVYRMRTAVPNPPGAGLITGADAVTAAGAGDAHVVNLDVASNGITIYSGAAVELGNGLEVSTLAGTSPRASVLDSDPSLAALTSADAGGELFFASVFGESMSQYKASPKTWLVTNGSCGSNARCTSCATASSCGSAVSTAYADGFRRFWADADLGVTGTLGSAAQPVVLVTTQNLELGPGALAYGMFYGAAATASTDFETSASGNAKVVGAIVSRGAFEKRGGGDLDVIYDPSLFTQGGVRGLMVRVPGSWRDKPTEY